MQPTTSFFVVTAWQTHMKVVIHTSNDMACSDSSGTSKEHNSGLQMQKRLYNVGYMDANVAKASGKKSL